MVEKEYIERQTARNAVLGFERYTGIAELPVEFAEAEIDKLPAADVAPVRHGRWKRVVDFTGVEAFCVKETMVVGWGCNVCGYEVDVSEGSFNFCPNCGADMRPTPMSGANGEGKM